MADAFVVLMLLEKNIVFSILFLVKGMVFLLQTADGQSFLLSNVETQVPIRDALVRFEKPGGNEIYELSNEQGEVSIPNLQLPLVILVKHINFFCCFV